MNPEAIVVKLTNEANSNSRSPRRGSLVFIASEANITATRFNHVDLFHQFEDPFPSISFRFLQDSFVRWKNEKIEKSRWPNFYVVKIFNEISGNFFLRSFSSAPHQTLDNFMSFFAWKVSIFVSAILSSIVAERKGRIFKMKYDESMMNNDYNLYCSLHQETREEIGKNTRNKRFPAQSKLQH